MIELNGSRLSLRFDAGELYSVRVEEGRKPGPYTTEREPGVVVTLLLPVPTPDFGFSLGLGERGGKSKDAHAFYGTDGVHVLRQLGTQDALPNAADMESALIDLLAAWEPSAS